MTNEPPTARIVIGLMFLAMSNNLLLQLTDWNNPNN